MVRNLLGFRRDSAAHVVFHVVQTAPMTDSMDEKRGPVSRALRRPPKCSLPNRASSDPESGNTVGVAASGSGGEEDTGTGVGGGGT